MTEQLTLDSQPVADIRGLVQSRITEVLAAFDDHEAGLEYPGPIGAQQQGDPVYACRCKFRGTEAEWKVHLADALAEALITTTVELPA